jgi:hypothetical protein
VFAANLDSIRQVACHEDVLESVIFAPNILNFGTTRMINLGKIKGKSVLVTGRRSLWGCETLSRLPHFLDNWIRDGSEASLTLLPDFTPKKISDTHLS